MGKNKTTTAEKQLQRADAGAAMLEYAEAKRAEVQKTERLRALRLAKEAEDRAEAERERAAVEAAKKEKAAAKRRKK